MLSDWVSLTGAINELNRSMGEPDLYPFVVSVPASDKLRFVHQVLLDPMPLREGKMPVRGPFDGTSHARNRGSSCRPGG